MSIRISSIIKLGLASLLISSSLSSCSKKQENLNNIIEETPALHTWYYFSDNNYYKTDKPSSVPAVLSKPWTEAVRISSASTAENTGYAVVNRSGILVFRDKEICLYNDSEIFTGRTAGNLVFCENVPVFSVFKSSFFNNSRNLSTMHPFLIQFNPDQNLCFPLISIDNLNLDKTCEITDLVWDGQNWTCSVKDSSKDKIEFSFMNFQVKEPLLSLSPSTAEKQLHINQASMDTFRSAKKPSNFNKAPERVKELLSTLPDSFSYTVTVYTAGGHSPRKYIHSKGNAETEDFSATVILADTWACAVFQDGTTFFKGALYDRQILNGGKTLAMRMPKLPAGFMYGDFAISGTNLYVSWEESAFFETGRSGFLCVNLAQALYKNGAVK